MDDLPNISKPTHFKVGGVPEHFNFPWKKAIEEGLFEKNNISLPVVWDDLITLAREGKVAVPAIPIDLLMNFYMFCIASGTTPFLNEQEVVNFESGKADESPPFLCRYSMLLRSSVKKISKEGMKAGIYLKSEIHLTTDNTDTTDVRIYEN